MAQFRKKPVVIEAWLFDGSWESARLIINRAPPGMRWSSSGTGGSLQIPTLEGEMTASAGDYVIQGVKGEFYPIKPDIFAATYEAA